MTYIMGTDEAGYGPNLGPLVVSASLWQVPDDARQRDLYELLGDAVSRTDRSDDRIPIADSKTLYMSQGSLASLERGLLPALAQTGRQPGGWQALFDALDPECAADRDALPWYQGYDEPLPIDADGKQIEALSTNLRRALEQAGVRCLSLRSAAIFPERFNRLVDEHGNKSTVLSKVTFSLIERLLAQTGEQPVLILCDKHGGRNKYARLLQETFPEYLVEIHGEGRAESVYRWGPPGQRVEIRFRASGEAFLPAALASMASKYLRELAMRALNQFWCARVDGLRPTAGYPVDARRFFAEIETAKMELGIDDRQLWRSR